MSLPLRKYVPDVRHNFGKFDVLYSRSEWGKAFFASLTIILKVQLQQHEIVSGTISDGKKSWKMARRRRSA